MSEDKQNLPAIEDMTFRQAMMELESIVPKLESNTMELEQCLEAYERGVHLLRALRSRLNAANQQVTVLTGELEQGISDEELESTLQKA